MFPAHRLERQVPSKIHLTRDMIYCGDSDGGYENCYPGKRHIYLTFELPRCFHWIANQLIYLFYVKGIGNLFKRGKHA